MIKEIKLKNKLLALLIGVSDVNEGTHPITDSKYALQLLMMKRKTGHVFAKHTHKIIPRTVPTMQEAIVITKGKLLVTVCDRDGTYVGKYEVSAGQCLFVVEGGFGIDVLEDVCFYEFKNGPHEDDKVLL
jgi:hypothetical protein